MTAMVHTKTFGKAGSYPHAVCGHKGGPSGRMRFSRADLLQLHPDACPDCLPTPDGQLRLEVGR
jgi:hypothetical protein